jgi:hypothetical protein
MGKNTYIDDTVLVRRGRVDSVNLYEVKENELEVLENGEETVIQLNFAIFLLSIAFSGVLTLCSATFKSKLLESTFLFSTIIGTVLGIYLLIMWWRGRKSIKKVIAIIKKRIEVDIIESESVELPSEMKTNKNSDLIQPMG